MITPVSNSMLVGVIQVSNSLAHCGCTIFDLEYGWYPWTIVLFVSFVWQVCVFSAYSNLRFFLFVWLFSLARLCLCGSWGTPWVPFFSFVLSCSFPFNCKSYLSLFVLLSMCLQHFGAHPLDRSSFFFLFFHFFSFWVWIWELRKNVGGTQQRPSRTFWQI